MAIARPGLADLSERLCALNTWVLMGFVVAGLLGIGLYKEILYVGALGIGLGLAGDPGLSRRLAPLLPVLAFVLALLATGELAKPDGFDSTAPKFLGLFLSAAACALSLATDPRRLPLEKIRAALLVICAIFVLAHGAACLIRGGAKGLFTNMHYLGLYSALTLPVLLFLWVERSRSAMGMLTLLLLAGDFWLLLRSGSRPAWLALMLGTLVVSPFLGVRHRTTALVAAVVLPALLYFSGWFDFGARVDGLVKDFSTREERVFIWSETFRMQMGSEPVHWLFGHGFDTYEIGLVSTTRIGRVTHFDFPHNFLLELLYVSGLFGLTFVLIGYVWLFWKVASYLLGEKDFARRRGALLLLGLTVVHLSDVFLTVSFFSSHNLVPLGLFLGLWLSQFRRPTQGSMPLAAT